MLADKDLHQCSEKENILAQVPETMSSKKSLSESHLNTVWMGNRGNHFCTFNEDSERIRKQAQAHIFNEYFVAWTVASTWWGD